MDLHKCYKLIPKRHLLAPPILDAVARHPLLCDLRRCSQAQILFKALLRQVSGRESLRECVRYTQTDVDAWHPDLWGGVPPTLWDDKALCLELLAMLPVLNDCLSDRLPSDPVVGVLLTAEPEYFYDWAVLLFFVPLTFSGSVPILGFEF